MEKLLTERYAFDVFKENAINFRILVTIWMPSLTVSTSWLLGQLRTQCGLGRPDRRR